MKVKHLIEQLLNYDPELPVHIAGLTEIDGYQWNLDSELIEISKLLHCIDRQKNLDTLIIGYKQDEFPEHFDKIVR